MQLISHCWYSSTDILLCNGYYCLDYQQAVSGVVLSLLGQPIALILSVTRKTCILVALETQQALDRQPECFWFLIGEPQRLGKLQFSHPIRRGICDVQRDSEWLRSFPAGECERPCSCSLHVFPYFDDLIMIVFNNFIQPVCLLQLCYHSANYTVMEGMHIICSTSLNFSAHV